MEPEAGDEVLSHRHINQKSLCFYRGFFVSVYLESIRVTAGVTAGVTVVRVKPHL